MTNPSTVKRIGGYLHRVVPVADNSGKIISYALKPFMVEFKARDAFQIIVGASVLATPLAFTEEVWKLAETLPIINIICLSLLSLSFICAFTYFNIYKFHLKGHVSEYIKRVLSTYLLSIIISIIILTIIQKCPWSSNSILAIKRVILISFPASMSATVSDIVK